MYSTKTYEPFDEYRYIETCRVRLDVGSGEKFDL